MNWTLDWVGVLNTGQSISIMFLGTDMLFSQSYSWRRGVRLNTIGSFMEVHVTF